MTRPWRRMIRHLLQIFLTLGLTFTANFFLMVVWGAVPPHELRASPALRAKRASESVEGRPPTWYCGLPGS